jgi:hypothetical protein
MIMSKTAKILLLSFMLTALFCGCSPEFWHPDEERTSNIDPSSPADLASYLATLPTNTASSPHNITLRITSVKEFSIIFIALDGAFNKYVYLDLSSSTITSIPRSAFYNALNYRGCNTLTGITIPNSVTSIGEDAFSNCSSLVSVTIPSSVTSIGNYAFSSTSLTNVTIPDSVTSIGESAFSNCTNLTSIAIGNSVTSIEGNPFVDCSNLSLINVSSGNSAYTAENGVLFNKSKTTLVAYPTASGSYTIPYGVTSIGDGAFAHTNLASITIPDSVTSIKQSAFYDCNNLASVIIGNSVTNIDYGAFGDCNKLSSVTFQGNIPSRGISNYYVVFPGDLREKFYALNPSNGTPGTYTRASGSDTWTKQ